MTILTLNHYRVSLLIDGKERHTLSVYAPGKRQAAVTASKQARTLLDARTIEIRRVRVAKEPINKKTQSPGKGGG